MTWRGEGVGGDAMWPILPLTTVLHLARPYKGKEKKCFLSLSLFPTVFCCIQVNFSAPVQQHRCSLNHASLYFPCSNLLPPYTPLPEA